MKTTEEWLGEVKASPEKLKRWLERQYVGEALAYQRIIVLSETVETAYQGNILKLVAQDEYKHMLWISKLLSDRGMELPIVSYEEDRYWKEVLEGEISFEETTAAGHLAEEMRLVRIGALAADPDIPEDIREVFKNILPDEEFHSRAFEWLTTPAAIEKMKPRHENGLNALGLTI